MFTGQAHHSIDPKGRLAIPARMRSQLSKGAMITKGLDRCLFVFTEVIWRDFEQKARSQPLGSERARNFLRIFFGNASEVDLDGQGRVMIPSYLREHAGLRDTAAIIGVSDRIEIWSEERWREVSERAEADYSALAEELSGYGF